MDYMKNLLIITIVFMFGYIMYLTDTISLSKERLDEMLKELSSCTNTLNYYKWVFENMPTNKYMQEYSSTSSGGWEHNNTINIPINLTGIKNRPP